MQNIQETIFYVCKVLKQFGIDFIQPNHFRQAKFNQPESRDPFFNLLKRLLVLELYDFDTKVLVEINDEILINLLKLRNSECLIENTLSQNILISSSRDLLLLNASILAESSVFALYSDQILFKIEEQLINISKYQPQIKSKKEKLDNDINIYNYDKQDIANEIVRLNNIIQQKLRKLKQLDRRKQSLHKKVYRFYYNKNDKILDLLVTVNPNQLPLSQVLLFLNDDYMKEQLNCLQKINDTLLEEIQNHRHQEIFWNWLVVYIKQYLYDSVIQEDSKCFKDHPEYGFLDQNLQVIQEDRDLQKQLKKSMEQLNKKRIEFIEINHSFNKEWERVSELLQNNQNCEDKLTTLELQIPKILNQQKKINKPFEDIKQEFQADSHLIQYNMNQFVKNYIKKILSNQLDENQLSKFEEDQKQIKIQAEQIRVYQNNFIKEIMSNLENEYSFYPRIQLSES